MKRVLAIWFVLVLVVVGVSADTLNAVNVSRDAGRRIAGEVPGPSCRHDLYAGQNMLVGEVVTTNYPDGLYVQYLLDIDTYPNLIVTEIHFGWFPVETMPINRPPNGHLQYIFEGNLGNSPFFTIPWRDIGDPDDFGFVAHAVVSETGCEDVPNKSIFREGLVLPEKANMKINIPGARGYFRVSLTSEGILNHDGYSGWCLSKYDPIRPNRWYPNAEIVSDWNELAGVIKHPENIWYIEWIVRSKLLNSYSEECGLVINRNHIQNAIWQFTEDVPPGVGCGAAMVRDKALAAFARAASKDFERNCWEQTATFVVKVSPAYSGGPEVQPIFVMIVGVVDCPTPTPTPTPRGTRTPRPTRTPRDTPTITPTPTATPSGTWTPPTETPTPSTTPTPRETPPPTPSTTPTATPTATPSTTPTATPTPTPPPTICDETAYAFGQWDFDDGPPGGNEGWGWAFNPFDCY